MTEPHRPAAFTIGILYPGELGAALGRLLAGAGLAVVTTVEGRSPRTIALCREAGLPVVPSAQEVVERADLVLSVVPPARALDVARRVAELRTKNARPIYVDLNSISP